MKYFCVLHVIIAINIAFLFGFIMDLSFFLLFTFFFNWVNIFCGLERKFACFPSEKQALISTNASLSQKACIPVKNVDVLRSLHFLAHPPRLSSSTSQTKGEYVSNALCTKSTEIQGIHVCEDNIDFSNCLIWSLISSNYCDHFGSLEFERYWGRRGCQVVVFHYFVHIKGNVCNTPSGKLKMDPNVTFVRGDMWGEKCFNCVYKALQKRSQLTKSKIGQIFVPYFVLSKIAQASTY